MFFGSYNRDVMPVAGIDLPDLCGVAFGLVVMGEQAVGFLFHVGQLRVAEAVYQIGREDRADHMFILPEEVLFAYG